MSDQQGKSKILDPARRPDTRCPGDSTASGDGYGFGAGRDALKNRTVTHTYAVQNGKWTCKGFGGRGTAGYCLIATG